LHQRFPALTQDQNIVDYLYFFIYILAYKRPDNINFKNTLKIRPYTKNDKVAVIALLRSNTPLFFAPAEEKDFIEYLDKEIEDYFVVEENLEIIAAGGINYFTKERKARISWDFIEPNSQGKGLGRKLTEHRINHLNQNHEIDLIIVRTTQLVYKFYQKMGFKLMKVEKNYWAKNFDLYHMELNNKNDIEQY